LLIAAWVVALLGLCVGVAMARQLVRLPYAPQCPRCRRVTADDPSLLAADRLWAFAMATPVRRCGACGWSGRMRWRLAPRHARS